VLAGGAAGVVALVAILGLASGDTPRVGAAPAADSAVFAGLDPGVVKEVLGNAQAQANASINPVGERDQLWQGEVMNWVMCRQMFNAYMAWTAGGQRPAEPTLDQRPTHPVSAHIVSEVQSDYRWYGEGIAANSITQLRDALTNQTGCGTWVPAKPGTKGPVIGDVVRGGPPGDGRPWPAEPTP
jgi:hypothetical protein